MMMLRIEDDDADEEDAIPETQDHTLCEPAHSKCTSTFHKSHFIQKFMAKMPRPRSQDQTLREPATFCGN